MLNILPRFTNYVMRINMIEKRAVTRMFRVPLIARRFAALAVLVAVAGCDSPEDRAAEHYARGISLIEAGTPEKAMLEFRNALELNEKHAPSHFALGEMLERRGKFQLAVARYEMVVELDPTHTDARVRAARIFLLSNELDQAARQIDAALTLAGGNARVHILNGALALKRDELPKVRAALDVALSLAPFDPEAALLETNYLLKTSAPSDALARLDQALENHPRQLPLHIMKLRILEQQKDQPEIGAQLLLMIEAFPEELRFREALSIWAVENDNPQIALTQLRALVAKMPGQQKPVVNLILFLHRQQGEEAARAELTRLIERSEDPSPLQLLLAKFDVEKGRRSQAINQLRGLLATPGSQSIDVQLLLAKLLIEEGTPAEADALIESILNQDPSQVHAVALKVSRLLDQGLLDSAAQTVRSGLQESPDNVRLLLLAGRTQELIGNVDLANDRFARAVRADNFGANSVQVYVRFLNRTGRWIEAGVVLEETLSRHKPRDGRLLESLAATRIRLEDWRRAERTVRDLSKFDPERARQLQAAILIGQERFDEGTELLIDLAYGSRRRASSIAALVQTYLKNGAPEKAIEFVDGLLAANPQHIQALGIRGNLHFAAEEVAEAEILYRKILEIDPKNSGAWSALARLSGSQGDKSSEMAVIQRGLEASPNSAPLLLRLAGLYEVLGDYDMAIDVYIRMHVAAPGSLPVANNLASLLADHRAGDPTAIEHAYRIASRLRKAEQPQYRDTYAWTRHLVGENDEALERIEPAVEALPRNPWVKYHQGMIFAALGRTREAREVLHAALELAESAEQPFPPQQQIRRTLATLKVD